MVSRLGHMPVPRQQNEMSFSGQDGRRKAGHDDSITIPTRSPLSKIAFFVLSHRTREWFCHKLPQALLKDRKLAEGFDAPCLDRETEGLCTGPCDKDG